MTNTNFDWAGVAEQVLGSVVTVGGAEGRPISGVVVNSGEVLTVAHVLARDGVSVRWNDSELGGTVVGRDFGADLALVRAEGLAAPAIRGGGAARVGAAVLAVARPSGPAVSGGLIGAEVTGGRMRSRRGGAGGTWLRTTAPAYPGFSGSALVNAGGEFVGLVNAGVSRGELLAVPGARALEIAARLASGASSGRGYLGVKIQEVRLEEGRPGLLVTGLEDDSPAARGGVLLGDILLTWNGEDLSSGGDLMEHVARSGGETVALGLRRGGQPASASVTLGARNR